MSVKRVAARSRLFCRSPPFGAQDHPFSRFESTKACERWQKIPVAPYLAPQTFKAFVQFPAIEVPLNDLPEMGMGKSLGSHKPFIVDLDEGFRNRACHCLWRVTDSCDQVTCRLPFPERGQRGRDPGRTAFSVYQAIDNRALFKLR